MTCACVSSKLLFLLCPHSAFMCRKWLRDPQQSAGPAGRPRNRIRRGSGHLASFGQVEERVLNRLPHFFLPLRCGLKNTTVLDSNCFYNKWDSSAIFSFVILIIKLPCTLFTYLLISVPDLWHFNADLDSRVCTLDYKSGSGSCTILQWRSRFQHKISFLLIAYCRYMYIIRQR